MAAKARVEQGGVTQPPFEGAEWEEARREGCVSPAELRLLKALRAAGLPEPQKQFEVKDEQGEIVTVADFAYPEQRLLIYVDGLAFHSALPKRLHDARITRWLQRHDWKVLRFFATEVYVNPERCVREVRESFKPL
jgi:very-short-patch-repair endonuclease